MILPVDHSGEALLIWPACLSASSIASNKSVKAPERGIGKARLRPSPIIARRFDAIFPGGCRICIEAGMSVI